MIVSVIVDVAPGYAADIPDVVVPPNMINIRPAASNPTLYASIESIWTQDEAKAEV